MLDKNFLLINNFVCFFFFLQFSKRHWNVIDEKLEKINLSNMLHGNEENQY